MGDILDQQQVFQTWEDFSDVLLGKKFQMSNFQVTLVPISKEVFVREDFSLEILWKVKISTSTHQPMWTLA